jgi:hypothetical protein
MNSISKIAIAIVAVALVIVIGLIVLSANTEKTEKIEATAVQPVAQATEIPAEEPAKTPEEEAQDEAQGNGEMYEGALAGLTEEEIGKLAMAEEQHDEGVNGEETAAEEGASEEAVAGVAD